MELPHYLLDNHAACEKIVKAVVAEHRLKYQVRGLLPGASEHLPKATQIPLAGAPTSLCQPPRHFSAPPFGRKHIGSHFTLFTSAGTKAGVIDEIQVVSS
jgi:hypothetical protein